MQSSLALTALLMGLVGGPHCIAMCGAACAGISQSAGPNKNSALWIFQIGRIVGYSVLGGLAAASLQGLGWLTVQSAALRPVWSLFHVAALVLGLMLLLQARQPVWLETSARKVWARTRSFAASRGRGAPLVLGVLWALLPCGLLYSALLVAALAGNPVGGAMVMALFAVGTSVTMVIGPWLWLRLRGAPGRLGSGQWGVRLAGAALAASSGWALWMGLAHNAAPWCATP
ncbi:MAG: sulfite exporter TauE/SafE family protein [Rhodoferax sp.]|nr:sulfite exporter TauE/SafE family protein [Rhodoferax sp.]MCF8212093.1 sulfite exporter TauE/SafE family protein [Rhodoferax sp.]